MIEESRATHHGVHKVLLLAVTGDVHQGHAQRIGDVDELHRTRALACCGASRQPGKDDGEGHE